MFQVLEKLQEQISVLSEQLAGLAAAHQVVVEVLISQSPQQKQALAQALGQILDRPETLPNQFALEQLQTLHQAAMLPSRTTPEGRRAGLRLVSDPADQPEAP